MNSTVMKQIDIVTATELKEKILSSFFAMSGVANFQEATDRAYNAVAKEESKPSRTDVNQEQFKAILDDLANSKVEDLVNFLCPFMVGYVMHKRDDLFIWNTTLAFQTQPTEGRA